MRAAIVFDRRLELRLWALDARLTALSAHVEAADIELDQGFAGVSLGFGRTGVRIGVNLREYDFDDVRTSDGRTINNDDRDRTLSELGGRVGYELAPNRTIFVQGVYNHRDYDEKTDDFGYERDSEGVRFGAGVAGKIGDVTAEAVVGVMSQDCDDPRFDTTTALDFGLDLTRRPASRTRLTATVERALSEATLFDSDDAMGLSATSPPAPASGPRIGWPAT